MTFQPGDRVLWSCSHEIGPRRFKQLRVKVTSTKKGTFVRFVNNYQIKSPMALVLFDGYKKPSKVVAEQLSPLPA